jgi:hypothetical protein
VAEAVSEQRRDPRSRPSDPAGTRPKFDPESLRPRGDFRALPSGEPSAGEEEQGPPPSEDESLGIGPRDDERLPEPVATAQAPAVSGPTAPSPHAPRVQFLLGALGALGVAAIVVAVSLALAPKPRPGLPWSSWRPSGDTDPAVQIAEHVAPQYTSSPGHLLVNVSGGPQEIAGQPVALFVRSSGSKPVQLEEQGVFYQLCGSGPNCSIPGKPSVQRGLLLQREALELALYTFRYVSGASQVVVTVPPPPPSSRKSVKGSKPSSSSSSSESSNTLEGASSSSSRIPTRVLLFRPRDLAEELSRPLDTTLASSAPTVATMTSAPEAGLVNQLTGKLVYDSTLIPQQSTPVLLLQQPSIGS